MLPFGYASGGAGVVPENVFSSFPRNDRYGMAKAAVHQLCRSLAREEQSGLPRCCDVALLP